MTDNDTGRTTVNVSIGGPDNVGDAPAVYAILDKKSNTLAALEGTAHTFEPGLVSVVIPNYNKGKYVAACIESVLRQTYAPLEIVFIDDRSDDHSDLTAEQALHSPEAMNLRAQGKLRVTFLRLPRRVGTAWAQNIGFYLARGEFLANQDSDDMSAPTRIAKQVAFLQANPTYSAAGTDYRQFTGPSTSTQLSAIPEGLPTQWLAFGTANVRDAYVKATHRVCWGTLMMRACVIDLISGNNKKFIGAEDFEIIHRMIVGHGMAVDNISEKLYYYRKSSTQRSSLFHGQ
jgi:glycosyltransferase involved in cell wall biosynthesis